VLDRLKADDGIEEMLALKWYALSGAAEKREIGAHITRGRVRDRVCIDVDTDNVCGSLREQIGAEPLPARKIKNAFS
jgi:hypothetical protein